MGIDISISDCFLGLGNFYPKGRNMTKQDIIRMAQEAGWDAHHAEFDTRIQNFAALVAFAEREACANICETLELPEWPDKVRQPLAQAIRARGQA